MQEFNSFPFSPDAPTQCTPQSAIPTPDDLVADFKSAHVTGEDKLAQSLQEHVYSTNTSLHASVSQSKLLTLANCSFQIPGNEVKMKATEMELRQSLTW